MKILLCFTILLTFFTCRIRTTTELTPKLIVSENRRFLSTENGDPFFWLGDTGWMLFEKLSREEAGKYFIDRKQKGFNVIQVMVIHDIKNTVNFYGDSALVNHDVSTPLITKGSSYEDPAQYDYWDNVDYLIDLARKNGLYMALVPVWGSNVRSGHVSCEQAKKYSNWLADRYKDKPNVIWVNGGDVSGSDSIAIWKLIGKTLREKCPGQLITFHPFGRSQSSEWFQNEKWLDFNMFQSGHRRYDQDTAGLAYGEDNWKYVQNDYKKIPVKPTLDGEPSYEGIPQGLHDPEQPYWNDSDVRRYAYWSVFAGGCGFTYGNNAIMQFYKPGNQNPAYGVKEYWDTALNSPGSFQMRFLKELMLSHSYFDRVQDSVIVAGARKEKYDFIASTRGSDYVFIYTWNGSTIKINSEKLSWNRFKASWFDPRKGNITEIGKYKPAGLMEFNPPGENINGNDWVLVLDRI
jgi:hypothetical protein